MGELGDFLRTRRSGLRPTDFGIDADGVRRQVTGLRREELARAAAISDAYYMRLEQGQSRNPSDGVLDALARVLRLSADERAYLHSLARPPRGPGVAAPEHVRPAVRSVLETLGAAPAMVLSRSLDVLAWNRAAHGFLGPDLDFASVEDSRRRPNVARMVFCDPHARDFYVGWATKAEETVAHLRLAAGQHPGDPRLAALVGELAGASTAFADLWSTHPVRDCTHTVREYRHPAVGRLVLHQEVMRLDDVGQSLTVYGAESGSSSAAALARLLKGAPAAA